MDGNIYWYQFSCYDFIVKCPDAVFDGSCRNFPLWRIRK